MTPIISVSGGKDSTALYLLAVEWFGQDFVPVFADTGNEHPVTVNYVRNLHIMAGGPPVQIVKADFAERLRKNGIEPSGEPFIDMVMWKKRFPSTKAQFCTEHLKMRPIRDWMEDQGFESPVMFTGIRAGESPRRAAMPENEWSDYYDCEMRRPLIRWSEEDVFAYLKEKGVPPNPLYSTGQTRVGCFPCIHANKAQLRTMPEWAWDKLEEWEARLSTVTDRFHWFHPDTLPRSAICPPLKKVREWSQTSRGGSQFNAFLQSETADVPACMSGWGHCE